MPEGTDLPKVKYLIIYESHPPLREAFKGNQKLVSLEYMKFPLRNLIFERIKQAGNITDVELMNSLNKEEIQVTDDTFNKILLDLEIFGLIRVSWIEKHKRRIEISHGDQKMEYVDSID